MTLRRIDVPSDDAAEDVIHESIATAVLAKRLHKEDDFARFPTTPVKLRDWIAEATGSRIPNKAVCPGHDAPFKFVADMFFHKVSEALVLANRAGGKTFDVAALHLANNYHKPGFEVSHIGAIDTQAKRCYAYYTAGLRHSKLREKAPEPHIRDTLWTNGSRIEILPGTEAQTQGGHPHVGTFDELEQGKRQPYENAKSMPVSYTQNGVRHVGQFVATSTRQTSLGLMQRALDEAEERGSPIYTWCIFETMEPCATCAGEECPLWEWCEGAAQKADGWRSLEEILTMFDRVGRDTWESQHLCIKPDARALIYAPFSELNVSDKAEYVPDGGVIWLSYDWGFTDPTHIGFLQVRDGIWYQFDELVCTNTSERTVVREAVKRIVALEEYDGPEFEDWEKIWDKGLAWPSPWPNVWPEAAGDPSAVQLRAELKEHGITAARPKVIKHNVEEGQDVLRAAILSGRDMRRLYVNPRCIVTIRALRSYRARELADGSFDPRPDPDPANHAFSHPCDSLRYLFWRVRRSLGLGGGASDD